ncbi:MAG: hypothetical protein QF567_01275 [Candidatus Pacearchaeota archaeon]|jgi:NOL1/NOP2/fmu family ribosome biogenesis protein|nr:hypothetical protein [Candidatus Pacearchaeota archaeon]MDP7520846.1 hypothetical protein [Candidatus Pacearchaeota archaeon]|tara:strand:+ start:5201 stop:5659 length:459 start_codon:yes stop_codon:yes gene_type:complete
MNRLKILNKNEKQEILNRLNKQFGIKDIHGIIVKRGEEKLFLFSGDYNERQIENLEKIVPIEGVGIYFAKIIKEEIRLSIEGTQILKNQIERNIFELNKEQVDLWMKGQELNIKTGKRGFLVMKYKKDFLGCGKASIEKITNFIPKSRRLKN